MISTKFAVFVATLTLVGVGSPLLAAAQEIEGNNGIDQRGDISLSQVAWTNEEENTHNFSLAQVMIAMGLLSSFGDQTNNCEAVQDADASVDNDATIVDR
jgi:hypothetical protein